MKFLFEIKYLESFTEKYLFQKLYRKPIVYITLLYSPLHYTPLYYIFFTLQNSGVLLKYLLPKNILEPVFSQEELLSCKN